MHAITLWQPWASLVAEGVKSIETRSWKAPRWLPGDYIAIHAAARKPPKCEHCNGSGCGPGTASGAYVECEWCAGAGVNGLVHEVADMPLGAVVATALVVDCVPVPGVMADGDVSDTLWADDEDLRPDEPFFFTGLIWWLNERQRPYGDFSDCRWAWLLDDIAPTTERCPWCDGRGIEDQCDTEYPISCRVCHGVGACNPVPAKGRQRVWRWNP